MSSDTETKFQDWRKQHGQKEPGAAKPITPNVEDPDFATFALWVGTHTALGRVTNGELAQALERAGREAGYVLTRIAVNG